MLALGLCLGVVMVSMNDADQTLRNGKLVSFKDLSLEFSSNSKPDEISDGATSNDSLDFVSALTVISRFIGAAGSIASDDITLARVDVPYPVLDIAKQTVSDPIEEGFDSKKILSAKLSISNLARASI